MVDASGTPPKPLEQTTPPGSQSGIPANSPAPVAPENAVNEKVVGKAVEQGNQGVVDALEKQTGAIKQNTNTVRNVDEEGKSKDKPVTPGPDENDEKLHGKINKLIDTIAKHADKIMAGFAAMVTGGSPLAMLIGKGVGDATKKMVGWLKPGKKKKPKSSKAEEDTYKILRGFQEGAKEDAAKARELAAAGIGKLDSIFGSHLSKGQETAKKIGANISKHFEGVKNILKKGVEATKQGVANATKIAKKQLEQSKLARFAKKVPGGGIAKATGKAVGAGLKKIKGMFSLKKMALMLLIPLLLAFFNSKYFKQMMVWVKEKLIPTLKKWWYEKIKPTLKAIWEWCQNKAFPALLTWWDDTMTNLTTMFENIKKRFAGWGEMDWGERIAAILGFFKEIGAAVGRAVRAGLKALLSMFGVDGESFMAKYWDPIAEWFSKLIESVILIFKDPMAGLKSLFLTLLEGAGNILMWLWNISFKPLLNGIGNFFTGIWEGMKKKFAGFDLWKTISDGFNSLWEIITGWFDIDWKAALGKLFSWLPDKVKKLFGIDSPGDKEKASPGTVPSDHYSEEELQEVEKRANQMARNAELQKQKDKNAAFKSTVKDVWRTMTGKGPKTPIDELIPVPLMERGGRATTAVSDATKEAQTAGAAGGNLVVSSTPIDQSSTSVAVHQGEHTTVLPTPRINSTVSEMNSFGQTTNPLIT